MLVLLGLLELHGEKRKFRKNRKGYAGMTADTARIQDRLRKLEDDLDFYKFNADQVRELNLLTNLRYPVLGEHTECKSA